MKYSIIIYLLAFFSFLSCTKEDDSSSPLEIDFTNIDMSGDATGSLDQQNQDGNKVTYLVKSALVTPLKGNKYLLVFKFQSNDSLRITFSKVDKDYNYQYPNDITENQLLYVVFNRDTLSLKESAVSIQPRPDENSFVTVTNVHTIYSGEFSGTVSKVPLVKSINQ